MAKLTVTGKGIRKEVMIRNVEEVVSDLIARGYKRLVAGVTEYFVGDRYLYQIELI